VSARGRAVTVLAAATVAGGVLGGAWALQAATLPAPDPGNLVAVRAMGWLAGERLVESTFAVGDGPSVRSSCVRTWLSAKGSREQAVRLTVAGRMRVIPIARPYVDARGKQVGRPNGPLLARLELAGCPPVLASQIAGLVRHGSRTPVGQARVAGRPALTLKIWTRAGRVTVYLDGETKRPFALTVAGRRPAGQARLGLAEPSSTDPGGSGAGA
jgi:hypothetical protein